MMHGEGFGSDCPEFLNLPDREKAMLEQYGISLPDPRKLILNTSQSSVLKGPLGVCPTLTPGGSYWIARRARQLLGKEAL
eukprot:10214080-Alexandrium_andersonii.AAC.1